MKKILSLLSFLMLAVVAMAADLTTGVTFKGTWGDKLGAYGTAEGEMKVTKVEGGLKFEVKSYAFKGYAFPDYTIVYTCEVGADGSFNAGGFSRGEITGDATVEGTAVSSMYWQQIKGTVTNESIDLYMRYCGANTEELGHVTFTGTAVAGETPSTPEPKAYKNVLNIVRVNNAKISYPNAEVLVLDKGEGKYAVTLPEFTDLDGNVDNCIGKLTFEANGVEEEGKIKLTANNVVTGTPEGGSVDWTTATYSVEMDATIEGETIVGKITLKLVNGDPEDGYEYTLTFGEAAPEPTAQNFNEAWVGSNGTMSGAANVKVLTYQDGTVNMTVTGLTDNGEPITVESTELTQGKDAQERVTYTGKAVNPDKGFVYDVVAVVYGDDAQPRIYMTLTTEWGFYYTIGENPDKPAAEPVDYTNVLMLKSLNGDTHQFVENNKLTVLEKGEGKYQFTVRGVVDKDETPVGDIVFEVNGVEENGKITYTAENVISEPLSDEWADHTAIISDFNAESQEGALKATFKLELGTGLGDEYKYDVTYDNIDPNQVVATKTYTDNLTVGHDAQTGDVTGYADKQVVFTKYINGESTVTFKEYPISETETRDLTFRGVIAETDMSEYGMGTVTSGEDMVMTPIEDETSAFYGKEISLFINISSYTAEKMEFTYEFGSEDGIYYVGQYGVEIEQPDEIVGSKTYTSNLSVDHDINLENEVVYENKQVKFDKYANGDVAVTFVAYPVSENETCDLSFRGKIQENDMGPMGKFIYGDNLVCKVENEASSFNGKTLYLNINIKLKEDGSPTFSYTFYNNVDEENADAEKIYNTGRFNFDNVVNGINGIETEMENGNVSIYTVGGAKLNTLYKGINIVRLANGKTIKVIK